MTDPAQVRMDDLAAQRAEDREAARRPKCAVPTCNATDLDPRGLIELRTATSPYRELRPACTVHYDLLVGIGMRAVDRSDREIGQ